MSTSPKQLRQEFAVRLLGAMKDIQQYQLREKTEKQHTREDILKHKFVARVLDAVKIELEGASPIDQPRRNQEYEYMGWNRYLGNKQDIHEELTKTYDTIELVNRVLEEYMSGGIKQDLLEELKKTREMIDVIKTSIDKEGNLLNEVSERDLLEELLYEARETILFLKSIAEAYLDSISRI